MSVHSFPPAPLVRLDNVTVRFGAHTVFSDLSLRIEAGGHLALLGPNGAGKSTLLRLVQGELRPAAYQAAGPFGAVAPPADAGRIYWRFDGREETSALSARERVRLVSSAQQSVYVRQGWNITGEEIILSGLDNAAMVYGELSSSHYERAARLAEAAHAPELLAMHAPAMSQGQLRLVLILRALVSRPALLLLDEPFDGLDSQARKAVNRVLRLVARKGCTLLVSAHREKDIPGFIDTVLMLNNGHPEWRKRTARLLEHAPGECSPDPCSGRLFAPAFQELPAERPRPGNPFTLALENRVEPLLRLERVDVFIERGKVLSDITWTVRHAEQWIVTGPNGSGKSTLLRLLYGEEFAAFGGTVTWCGGLRPSLEDLRAGIGYVSDRLQYGYAYDISAESVVISGLRGSIGLYGEALEKERALARAWLDRLGVLPYADTPLSALSSGIARRVLLARAFAGSPRVLLLDEPCSGLDAASRSLVLNALSVLAAQGVRLIYVSHHEEEMLPVFTHELRLEKGRVVFAGERRARQ